MVQEENLDPQVRLELLVHLEPPEKMVTLAKMVRMVHLVLLVTRVKLEQPDPLEQQDRPAPQGLLDLQEPRVPQDLRV